MNIDKTLKDNKELMNDLAEMEDQERESMNKEINGMDYWWKRAKAAEKELKETSQILDSIKYELSGHTYTLNKDEFGQVFYARDRIDLYLEKLTEKA